jgi:hypothetical protein
MSVMLHGAGVITPVWVFVDDDITEDELEDTPLGTWEPVGQADRPLELEEALSIAAYYIGTGPCDFGEDDERNGMAAALHRLWQEITREGPFT